MVTPLFRIVKDKLHFSFHAGQARAWKSERRFPSIIAGSQSGKTEYLSPWLWREIKKRGAGDYIGVAPTFPLMTRKLLPAFKRLFVTTLRLGSLVGGTVNRFTMSADGEVRLWGARQDEPTNVFFGHASDPDSLESATVKAAILDECGMAKFRRGSWDAIQRRLAIHTGRALMGTTPYNLGWLKQEVYDRWKAGDKDYDVIQFESIMNPSFPRDEFERARRLLPAWKFNMFYRGLFERPAGMIYDCFDFAIHKVPKFAVDPTWKRYLGIDFGGVNTAAVFLAEDPKKKQWYVYDEYHAGGRTAAEHAAKFRAMVPGTPIYCVGGSKSEGQWRDEFKAGGLPVREPDQASVEVGIDRLYGAIKSNKLFVMDHCSGLLDEIGSYSRPVDDAGNPQEGIENKADFHLLDSARYIVGWLNRGFMKLNFGESIGLPAGRRNILDDLPEGVFG